MFRNHYTHLNQCQSYVRNRYNTFNMQSHPISNKRDTEINELHTHEDNVIISMELDNENDDTENEEIIGEESSRENPRILFSKEESSEESSEESNEESDEEFSEESSGEYSSDKINEESDEEFSEKSSGEYSNDESSDESSDESNEEPMKDEKIVDESLKREYMLYISGEFAPYFSNITEALMFCWNQKHNILTQAYDELVDIIHHPQFKSEDIVTNIRCFRKY
ncbi:hypothetical protein RhiirC2_716892 [Rhizophagus irregularis]|uniref:Uncharacterized protein n=1 Tax=Rhizophagus irregularis TaxID=588596 RepID=A0A2N1MPJ4_9GLOM|nr:hypothetical protein RhiirC2_716892 [Rhizophagus irregularis]